jgi:hypothetical protein
MAQQTRSKSSKRKASRSKRRKDVNPGSEGSGRNKSPLKKDRQKEGSVNAERKSEIRNQGGDKTVPERMYEDYTVIDPVEISDTDEPDVIVDVPVVKVDEIHFELDDLMARISLHAEVLDLVKLSVGVHVELGKVELDIKGVEAQALMRARLDHVTAIIDRVLTTLDRNPEVLKEIAKSLKPVTEGAGKAVGEVGEGAGSAVEDVGEGAGDALGGLGGIAGLAGGAASGGGGGNGGNGGGNGGEGVSGGQLAKAIAKLVAKELGSAASDEAKDLGLAATHKAMELGERRRQRRAEKHNATAAALRKAEEHGVDIDHVEGTGAEGRVTVHDVEKAAAA